VACQRACPRPSGAHHVGMDTPPCGSAAIGHTFPVKQACRSFASIPADFPVRMSPENSEFTVPAPGSHSRTFALVPFGYRWNGTTPAAMSASDGIHDSSYTTGSKHGLS
jgi:hypothetical protein